MGSLLYWTIAETVELRAIHIPGTSIDLADALFRVTIPSTEWLLHQGMAKMIFADLHSPHIDLFAWAENTCLPVHYTGFPRPQAWATDTGDQPKHVHIHIPAYPSNTKSPIQNIT